MTVCNRKWRSANEVMKREDQIDWLIATAPKSTRRDPLCPVLVTPARLVSVLPIQSQPIFDAAKESSTSQNPNGAWSYGWWPTGSQEFRLFGRALPASALQPPPSSSQIWVWHVPSSSGSWAIDWLSVACNTSTVPELWNYEDVPIGSLHLHRGPNDENSVVHCPEASHTGSEDDGVVRIEVRRLGPDSLEASLLSPSSLCIRSHLAFLVGWEAHFVTTVEAVDFTDLLDRRIQFQQPKGSGSLLLLSWQAAAGCQLQHNLSLETMDWQAVPSTETTNRVTLPQGVGGGLCRLTKP